MKNRYFKRLAYLLFLIILTSCNKEESIPLAGKTEFIISKYAAQKIAGRFSIELLQNAFPGSNSTSRTNSDLPYRDHEVLNSTTINDKNGKPALYIFNYASDSGFVVISADIRHEPICAYIDQGSYNAQKGPPMAYNWFNKTVENIEILRENRYDNTDRARTAWNHLLQETDLLNEIEVETGAGFKLVEPTKPGGSLGNCEGSYSSNIVGPLIPVRWGQGCTYNELCPVMSCNNTCYTNQNAWTGCVATSMCQVLRYWHHPNSLNYNYGSMPLTSGNGEVQRMMRDVGNSVGMVYGCNGSAAYSYKVPTALKNFFGFSTATYSGYNQSTYSTVLSNITGNKPILFEGFTASYVTGHSWVCDGYMSTTSECFNYLYYHMNWGWHEVGYNTDFVGYYAINNWNVAGMQFNYAQHMVHNIHP
jgi:hypothetical protein